MPVKIEFPDLIQIPLQLPLYATLSPGWTDEKVADVARCFGVKGDCVDAGAWYVTRDDAWTLEVYQASHSLRLERSNYDAEARGVSRCAPDRDKAMAVASRFMAAAGPSMATPEFHSLTELRVSRATGEKLDGEARVVGLQVNYRCALDGLPLVGPGAKAQVSVGLGGELAQAYRFSREVREVSIAKTIPLSQALERFQASDHFADLAPGATVRLTSIELGLLCLPPTEAQGFLAPTYVLRGEVSTELQPRHGFIAYVAAAELDHAPSRRRRFPTGRPSLLGA
ncbi:hypothetical protein [uncultured Phenylobacterium sp.]|uniref:hypothetical protein n=1 Tax=uncultured Phenylobacterium sp. TaxID=349273 RepID=UPI0025ED29D4|nr:hypothetical protein [uncultured Phenylobacterium sp.]